MSVKTVGMVGVGLMGHGIISNIQKSGSPVGFLNHPGNQSTDDLVNNGATEYQSLETLGAESDIVIICVTGSSQVETILTGESNLLTKIKPGSVIIDCSTATPASTRKMAKIIKATGCDFLDAPMTRTPHEAALGKLNLIVGGNKTLFNTHLSLLQTFAENITYAGETGSGHTMKLLHNYVSLGYSCVLAEAVAAARRSQIDSEKLHEVLAAGGGAGIVLDRMTPFILDNDIGNFAFTVSNSAKDLGYYTNMCKDLEASSAVAEAVAKTFSDQVENGNSEAYVPQMIEFL